MSSETSGNGSEIGGNPPRESAGGGSPRGGPDRSPEEAKNVAPSATASAPGADERRSARVAKGRWGAAPIPVGPHGSIAAFVKATCTREVLERYSGDIGRATDLCVEVARLAYQTELHPATVRECVKANRRRVMPAAAPAPSQSERILDQEHTTSERIADALEQLVRAVRGLR